jgi:hypothetical protein
MRKVQRAAWVEPGEGAIGSGSSLNRCDGGWVAKKATVVGRRRTPLPPGDLGGVRDNLAAETWQQE